jgi:predicted Zn-dependent protease
MNKAIIQFLLLVAFLVALWFGLSNINWLKIFKVEEKQVSIDEKVGELVWELFENQDFVEDSIYTESIDTIVNKLISANQLEDLNLKVYIIDDPKVNAFAIPGNKILILRGLIDDAKNEQEIAGVIAHELIHIKNKHVMKKLTREIGLSVLLTVTTGNENATNILKTLTTGAYDRNLEQEADKQAIELICNANINPNGLSDFLFRLSQKEPELQKQLTWFNSHPDTEERVEYILEEIKNKNCNNSIPLLHPNTWNKLKNE